jgi:hypothetical protein
MEPKTPVIPGSQVDEVCYAKDQPEYVPLPAVRTPDGWILTRWELTAEERAAIADGGCIYLSIGTFGNPLQPVGLSTEIPAQFRFAVPKEEWEDRVSTVPVRRHIAGVLSVEEMTAGCIHCGVTISDPRWNDPCEAE